MTLEQILAGMKAGKYMPLYFLTGDEPWYIDKITDFIENNALREDQRDFDQHVYYGRDINVEQIIETTKSYPFLAEKQLVIVKEAQDLKKIELLENYIRNPVPSTILVICYKNKKPDKRKSFTKLLLKQSVYFESKKIYEDKIHDWVISYGAQHGFRIAPDAAVLLAEHTGVDLYRIENELNKLFTNIPAIETINAEVIQDFCGISREYNNFELQKALGGKKHEKAAKIALYLAKNQKQNPLTMTIAILYSFFSKVLLCHYCQDRSPKLEFQES